MERMENKTKLLIEEVEKHLCLYNCMFVLVLVLEVDGLCSHVSCSHPYLTNTCPAGF